MERIPASPIVDNPGMIRSIHPKGSVIEGTEGRSTNKLGLRSSGTQNGQSRKNGHKPVADSNQMIDAFPVGVMDPPPPPQLQSRWREKTVLRFRLTGYFWRAL
ncbi:hypothetical protein TNIN_251991 [Trichonephila inaurata madagascariensis]|uniref:Uncharacterized protein n=1 Tax=Trichonephila inaurata madagascariensis TaxID=2747483 RepID=A0A8X6WYV1_9ARAC|nr:hypothetical protein TNIN_251991 [Trichonephila inaurata madagascariensis]